MRLLIEIGQEAPPERVDEAIRAKLARKVKIPGFGHRVYRTEDPRATHLRRMSKELGKKAGQHPVVRDVAAHRNLVTAEKKLYPNVDFYSASTYYTLGIDIDLFTPIFAVSRVSGWTAHCLEQYAEQPPDPSAHRLHRPAVSADVSAARPALGARACGQHEGHDSKTRPVSCLVLAALRCEAVVSPDLTPSLFPV